MRKGWVSRDGSTHTTTLTVTGKSMESWVGIRDGNEYPVNQVLARTSDYRIPKSVFGYSENFFL